MKSLNNFSFTGILMIQFKKIHLIENELSYILLWICLYFINLIFILSTLFCYEQLNDKYNRNLFENKAYQIDFIKIFSIYINSSKIAVLISFLSEINFTILNINELPEDLSILKFSLIYVLILLIILQITNIEIFSIISKIFNFFKLFFIILMIFALIINFLSANFDHFHDFINEDEINFTNFNYLNMYIFWSFQGYTKMNIYLKTNEKYTLKTNTNLAFSLILIFITYLVVNLCYIFNLGIDGLNLSNLIPYDSIYISTGKFSMLILLLIYGTIISEICNELSINE